MSDETIFIRVSRALSDTPNGILHSRKQCSVGRTLIRHLPRFLLSFFLTLYICIYPIMFPGLLQITVKVLWITLASVTDLSILTLLSFLYSVSFFCLLSICHYLLSFSLSVISLVFIICHYYLIFSFLSLNLLCYSIPFILFIHFPSFTLLFSCFTPKSTNFSVSFSRMFR